MIRLSLSNTRIVTRVTGKGFVRRSLLSISTSPAPCSCRIFLFECRANHPALLADRSAFQLEVAALSIHNRRCQGVSRQRKTKFPKTSNLSEHGVRRIWLIRKKVQHANPTRERGDSLNIPDSGVPRLRFGLGLKAPLLHFFFGRAIATNVLASVDLKADPNF
jgi:hypothetical protein